MLHTTFNLLSKADASVEMRKKLALHLGGVYAYGADTPIPLSVVLDRNGLNDAAWCLRATAEPADAFARDFACDCAEMVAILLWDQRSRDSITTSRRYARGLASEDELDAARVAAWDAARATGSAAIWGAAWGAAGGAAGAAAWASAENAADAVGAAVEAAVSAAAWAAARDASLATVSAAARDAAKRRLSRRLWDRLEAHGEDNPLGEISTPIVGLVEAEAKGHAMNGDDYLGEWPEISSAPQPIEIFSLFLGGLCGMVIMLVIFVALGAFP